mgnify:CR=1 FL=1
MEKSKVYFTSFKATGNEKSASETSSSYEKLPDLKNIDFKDKYAAVKNSFWRIWKSCVLTSELCKSGSRLCKGTCGNHFNRCNTLC